MCRFFFIILTSLFVSQVGFSTECPTLDFKTNCIGKFHQSKVKDVDVYHLLEFSDSNYPATIIADGVTRVATDGDTEYIKLMASCNNGSLSIEIKNWDSRRPDHITRTDYSTYTETDLGFSVKQIYFGDGMGYNKTAYNCRRVD